MQVCGTCGAKSWGPLTRDFACNDYVDWLYNGSNERPRIGNAFRMPLTDFYRCDNCGVWALKSAVDHAEKPDPLTNAFAPAGIGFEANPFASAQGIMETFKRSLPAPETRLERIAKVVLGVSPRVGSGQPTDDYAAWVVYLAHCIETELDRAETLKYSAPSVVEFPQPPDADFPQV